MTIGLQTGLLRFLPLLALVASASLLAQPTNVVEDLALLYGDDETISVATGSSKAIHLAPSIASVITADDIRALGANSLEDVLLTVPGVNVSLRSIYASNYSMRGVETSYGPQILLLLNGHPFSELYSGAKISIGKVPIRNVKRVEIIRGPGSAVYGADAFSGVINIITYDNDDINTSQVGAAIGNFDTSAVWLQTKFDISDWQLGVFLEWEKSDGDDNRILETDLQTTFDSIFSSSASQAPGVASTHYRYINSEVELSKDKWRLTLNIYYQDKAGIGTGIADALDPSGNQYYFQNIFDINYTSDNAEDSAWYYEANFNYENLRQKSSYTVFPAGTVLPIGVDGNVNFVIPAGVVFFPDGYLGIPFGEDDYYSLDIASYFTGFNNHRLRLASGYKSQALEVGEKVNFGPGVINGSQPVVDGTLTNITNTGSIFIPNVDRQNYYFSIQDEWSFYKDWEATLGLRLDHYSDFGNTINPRLALVWQTNYKLTTKFLYGHAFRAPSVSELYAVNNPQILGNPDLDPETVKTLELSFDYRFSYDVRAQFNLFSYKAEDLINFIPDNNAIGSSTAQNTPGQDGYGFEIETSYDINEQVTFSANYSWQRSTNDTTNKAVADAPQQLLYAGVDWKLNSLWGFNAHFRHVADRPRDVSDMRPALDDYTFVNINLYSQRLYDHWNVTLSAHNLFDEDAMAPGDPSVPIDHPLQGRSILLEALYTLN